MREKEWENAIYEKIIEIYEKNIDIGGTPSLDPFIYYEIIKLMEELKRNTIGRPPHLLKQIIANALILIILLFFNNENEDHSYRNKKYDINETQYIREVMSQVI